MVVTGNLLIRDMPKQKSMGKCLGIGIIPDLCNIGKQIRMSLYTFEICTESKTMYLLQYGNKKQYSHVMVPAFTGGCCKRQLYENHICICWKGLLRALSIMWFNIPIENHTQETVFNIWCQENLYLQELVHFLLSNNKNGTIYPISLFALPAREFRAKLDDQS